MTKSIDPCKVAIYIRWSTDDQSDGTTLEVQLEGCKAYLVSQGWTVTEDLIFVDDGYSGGNMDRPALKKMRKMIQEELIDCVVVFKLDRLSRNVVDMVRLVIEEWGDLCYLKSAREAIDTTNHAGRMFFYTLTSFAEWERATIKDRTFSGKLKRAQAGRNPGMRAPFGYKTVNGEFVIVEQEAEVVRRIFARYRMGLGMTQIAHELNNEGISHRTRPVWDKTEVQRVLANPIYVGDFVYGRRSRNPRKGKQTGVTWWKANDEPMVLCSGVVPAIVSRDVWEHAQSLRASRPSPATGQSGRAYGSSYLLSGLLKCSNCGRALYGKYQMSNKLYYYICTGQHGLGSAVCDCGVIRMDHLDEHVVAAFRSRYGCSKERDAYLAEYVSGLEAERQALLGQLELVKAEEDHLTKQAARIRRDYRAGDLTIEELRTHEGDLKEEAAEVAAKKDKLMQSLKSLEATINAREFAGTMIATLDTWGELSPIERKTVLRHFVAEVRAYKPKGTKEIRCHVVWKVTDDGNTTPSSKGDIQ